MVKESIVVVKFGGSCLESGEAIGKAAEHILNEYAQGKGLVVVVSALNGMTNSLISWAQSCTNGKVKLEELDEIMAMGERTSARLMMSSLNSKDMDTVLVDPASDLWPIYTNSRHGDAEPDMIETRKAVQERILPLIKENKVIVVPGFLGKDKDTGKITTLGRNGSDTTAVLLGNCLDASEVILVKDVEGIYSGDPKKIAETTLIEHLDIEEVLSLTSAGAKIVHSKALRFKPKDMDIRLVGFHNGQISKGGTLISGAVLPDLHTSIFSKRLQMITIVGKNVTKAENVHLLIDEIRKMGCELIGASLESGSVIFYATIPEAGSVALVRILHEKMIEAKIGKAITNHDDLALITISGRDLETTPGVIERISHPFTEMNLYGFLTINSNIRVFVDWNERESALKQVKEALNLPNQ
ncbi:MAG: aspartate kinase [Promethearchaeota archaeon]